MIDKTQAMDRLIAQDADLIDMPTQTDALREKINRHYVGVTGRAGRTALKARD